MILRTDADYALYTQAQADMIISCHAMISETNSLINAAGRSNIIFEYLADLEPENYTKQE